MCKFESGIVVFKGDDIEVFTHPSRSSHLEIRDLHNLRDSGELADWNSTPVELYPITDLLDVSTWVFGFDDGKPSWWQDWMEEKVRRVLGASAKRKLLAVDGVLSFEGDLYLSSLTTLPPDVKLSAGGNLYLDSLTTLPPDVKLSAGWSLDLSSLTTLPQDVQLSAKNIWDGANYMSVGDYVKQLTV